MNTKLILLFLTLCFFTSRAFPQGSLTPTAAPTPTMKTLDQIEARTIINASNTPGDGTDQFVITSPGSYYLTGNITGVSGKNGISIQASNVTVDLNGFALIGVSGAVDGLVAPAAQKNIRVHDGSARSWGGSGFNLALATNSQYDHLHASQNGDRGLIIGSSSVISQVTVEANASDGIYTSNNCTISLSTSVGNFVGFNTQDKCTIIACTASTNISNGIYPSSDCVIKDCNASGNGGWGIRKTGDGGVISHCAANGNSAAGILVVSNCQLIDNDAIGNHAEGILTLGTNNRIDSNLCVSNTSYGIKSSGPTADFITRNSCENNNGTPSGTATPNYSPRGGAYFGLLTTPGNASATAWSNFE